MHGGVEKYNKPNSPFEHAQSSLRPIPLKKPCVGWELNVMLESKAPNTGETLEALARRTPTGAVALCTVAVAIVIGIWIAFYLFAFLPRGMVR
jgi:hypothetical protein